MHICLYCHHLSHGGISLLPNLQADRARALDRRDSEADGGEYSLLFQIHRSLGAKAKTAEVSELCALLTRQLPSATAVSSLVTGNI